MRERSDTQKHHTPLPAWLAIYSQKGSRSFVVEIFIRWNGDRFEEREAIADAAGWRRRQGEKREYWIKPKVWREEIFGGDDDQALAAAQALKGADLLRAQSSDRCQAVVALAPKGARPTRAYVVRGRILDWRPGAYVAAKQQVAPLPVMPDNFSELMPEEKQNILLSSAIYLQARLLSSGLALDPQDTKAIAQLASVAQGIVRTSVELEQLKVDRNALNEKRKEKIRYLISKIPEHPDDSTPPIDENVKRPFLLTPRT